MKLTYTTVAQAIGEVAVWWSGVESMAHGIALRLAIHNEPAFETETAVHQLNLILANMGQRQLFAAVKALAFEGSPNEFFPALEPVLNKLDNEIRVERNRYVHDSWFASGEAAERTSRSTKIVNRQGVRELLLNESETYSSFDEIDDLVKKLKGEYYKLEEVAEAISAQIAERQAQRQQQTQSRPPTNTN